MKLVGQSLLIFVCFTLLTGLVYPCLMTGFALLAFPDKANGSMIRMNGKVVGSGLIGQDFSSGRYFHGRPSSLNYQADNSGGYNYGPASSNLIMMVSNRILDIRKKERISALEPVPSDMVLASGSGLDPDISVENAMIQAKRVASVRKLELTAVEKIVRNHTDKPLLGIVGVSKVNVLKLNLEIDKISEGNDK